MKSDDFWSVELGVGMGPHSPRCRPKFPSVAYASVSEHTRLLGSFQGRTDRTNSNDSRLSDHWEGDGDQRFAGILWNRG